MIALMTIVGMTGILSASGHCGEYYKHKGMHHKSGIHKILKKLNLSESQKKELTTLKESQKANIEALKKEKRSQMQENRKGMDMSQFMTKNHFDKEAYKSMIKNRMEQQAVRMQSRTDMISQSRAENMQKIFNILTPEQREKLIQLSQMPR